MALNTESAAMYGAATFSGSTNASSGIEISASPKPSVERTSVAAKAMTAIRMTISVSGTTLRSLSVEGLPLHVEEGERLIVYLDHIGGLEGTATEIRDDGFVMQFAMTEYKREKLTEQLTWLLNRDANGLEAPRRHVRSELTDTTSKMTLSDGQIMDVHVLDVSISGASIGTDARPTRNSIITLGKLRARVIRHHDKGIGVEFTDIQQPEALRKYFG